MEISIIVTSSEHPFDAVRHARSGHDETLVRVGGVCVCGIRLLQYPVKYSKFRNKTVGPLILTTHDVECEIHILLLVVIMNDFTNSSYFLHFAVVEYTNS